MKDFIKKHKVIAAIAGALTIGVSSTAIVMSAIPHSQTGQLNACYRNTASLSDAKGALRVINSENGETCSAQETATKWPGEKGSLMVDKLANADLSEARYLYYNLKNVDFSGSNITAASFAGSDLQNSNFSSIQGSGEVNFTNANLSNVNFTNAVLAMRLKGAILTNTNFTNALFDGVSDGNFTSSNLTGLKLGFVLSSNFANADLRTLNTVSNIIPSLVESNFTNVNFSNVTFYGFASNNTNFTNANFTNVVFETVAGYDRDTRTLGGNFTGANFTGATIKEADFSYTNLSGANFTNATWLDTICPDLSNSDNNGNTCIGHLIP